MNDLMDKGMQDPRVIAQDLQNAIEKAFEENDKALEWASREIERYRNLMFYMIKSQISSS